MLQSIIKIWQMQNILTGAAGRTELTRGFIPEVFQRKHSDFFFWGLLLLLTLAVMPKKKSDNGKISTSLIPALHILVISLTDICVQCYLLHPAKHELWSLNSAKYSNGLMENCSMNYSLTSTQDTFILWSAGLCCVPAGAQNALHTVPSLQHPLIQTKPS